MNIDYFRRMFAYNDWAHRKVWACARALTDEQYYRPCDYSVGSVHDQLVHTYGAERLWLGRVREEANPVFPSSQDYPNPAALRPAWDELTTEWQTFVAGLNDADLSRDITYTSINGNARRVTPIWQALAQILNHGTDHRAQTLSLIHQVGGETVAQDFIFYNWEQ